VRRLLRSDCGSCDGKGYLSAARCKRCGGAGLHGSEETLKVKVPAGVATGQKLKLKNKGSEAAGSGPAGDLFVLLSIEEHPLFRRRGTDLLCEVPLPFADAVLGTELTVPLLEGTTSSKIPPGTPSGCSFRLPGRGLPGVGGNGRGDLHVKVLIEIPPSLNAEQRAALSQFQRLTGLDAHPQRKAWVERMRSRV